MDGGKIGREKQEKRGKEGTFVLSGRLNSGKPRQEVTNRKELDWTQEQSGNKQKKDRPFLRCCLCVLGQLCWGLLGTAGDCWLGAVW